MAYLEDLGHVVKMSCLAMDLGDITVMHYMSCTLAALCLIFLPHLSIHICITNITNMDVPGMPLH